MAEDYRHEMGHCSPEMVVIRLLVSLCSAIAMIRNASVFFEWDLFVEPPADPLFTESTGDYQERAQFAGA